MKIKFKRLSEFAIKPTKAHTDDAGYDFYATDMAEENGAYVYHTGIAVDIPQGYVGLVFPRSSVARTDIILTNCVGVIDSGYTGEVTAKFKILNGKEQPCIYHLGERIFQMIIIPIPEIEFEEVNELRKTDRGSGGYGSSGK